MADDQVQGVPAGLTEEAIPQSAPAVQGVPAGLTEEAIPATASAPQAAAPPSQTSQQSGILDKIDNVARGAESGIPTGFIKGLGDTVSGVSHLINKIPGIGETLAPSEGISALDQMDVSHGTAEMAGKGLENIAEYAAGDEVLKGLSSASKLVALAKKYPQVAEVLNMAKEHPVLAKLITAGTRGAAVGGAQGAIKGAQEGNAEGGAEAGAAGGALGGPLEAGEEALPRVAKIFGLGGLNYKEAGAKALRARVTDYNAARSWDTIKPIVADIDPKSFKTVGEFEDILHDKADDLWKTQVEPVIQAHAGEVIDGKPIRDQIRNAVTRPMQKYFPEEAAEIERFANNFNGTTTLGEANEDLQAFNAKLKQYYKASPVDKAAILKTNGALTSLESAADGLRDQIYGTVDKVTGSAPGTHQDVRRQYGALKDIERIAGKRAVVEDRQAPLSFAQVIGLTESAGALLAGHPVVAAAGALPTLVKNRGTSTSLIKQAIGEASSPSAVGSAIKGVVNSAVPNLASQSSQHQIEPNDSTPNLTSAPSAHTEPNDQGLPVPKVKGLIETGNIDVNHRPVIWNADGTPSTIYSATVPAGGGKWALVPTIADGRFLTPDGKIPKETDVKAQQALEDAAYEHYKKTGEHLGVFDSEKAADDYAEKTHAWMPDGSAQKVFQPDYKGESNMPLTQKEYEEKLSEKNSETLKEKQKTKEVVPKKESILDSFLNPEPVDLKNIPSMVRGEIPLEAPDVYDGIKMTKAAKVLFDDLQRGGDVIPHEFKLDIAKNPRKWWDMYNTEGTQIVFKKIFGSDPYDIAAGFARKADREGKTVRELADEWMKR